MEYLESKPKTSPLDFFLYLGVTITLYASIVSWLSLLFVIINRAFPDALDSIYHYGFYSGGTRAAIASLIVIVPLYLLLSWSINRDLLKFPKKVGLWVRRWLSYITLFLTGAAVVIDLIVLITSFLGGEITLRFVLKVLVVLIVAGGVFGYYLYDLRRPRGEKSALARMCAWTVSVLVLASIIGGIVVIGSPTAARDMRFDQERVRDLQTIQFEVIRFWQSKETLPQTLDELENDVTGFIVPIDPETGVSYEYTIREPLVFELCAEFALPNPHSTLSRGLPGVGAEYWQHDAGRSCFERTIDPELLDEDRRVPLRAPLLSQ